MSIHRYPYIALALGMTLLSIVQLGSRPADDGTTTLPLLTLLLMSEFGFFATAIGAWIGVRKIRSENFGLMYVAATGLCAILSVILLLYGLSLWPR